MITRTEPVEGIASAQGLDVSSFQGEFSWAGARREVPDLQFGMFRLTQGLGGRGLNSPDPDAFWNHEQIKDQNLARGAYHFLDPFLSGQAQAHYYLSAFDKLGLAAGDMLFCDNETPGVSPAATAACALAFMRELDTLAPRQPRGVYTFIDFARQGNCAGLGAYPLWLANSNTANVAPMAPPPWTGMKFWQWGERNGDDADAFMGTAGALEAWLASFTVSPLPAPAGPSVTPGKGFADFGWGALPGETEYHFQVELLPHGRLVADRPAVTATHIGGLALTPGSYRWRVSGRAPRDGEWSTWRSFSVS
jgi:hypothetical protein